MKVKMTKFGHSCVLAEVDGKVALFDPGVWSEEFSIDLIDQVDHLAITHEHPDHLDPNKIREVMQKFPEATLAANDSVRAVLQKNQLVDVPSDEGLVAFESPHDPALPILGAEAPEGTGYHFADVFTHPGDNNSPKESKAILAMPFIAPWGKSRDGVEACVKLKPKYVIAIHDWHLSDAGREWYDGVFKDSLATHDIEFIPLTNGQPVEIEV